MSSGLSTGAWSVGLTAHLLPSRGIDSFTGDQRVRTWGLQGEARWTGKSGPLEPWFGVAVGGERRAWEEDGDTVLRQWLPVIGLEGGIGIPLSRRLSLVPSVTVARDLANTILGDDERIPLSPWEAELRFALEVRPLLDLSVEKE